jgi:mono/diheme cytochrome c family protein
MRRWPFALGAALLVIAVAPPAWIYARSEALLHRRHPLPVEPPLPKPSPEAVAAGARLAVIYGCTDCHGDDLQGRAYSHPDPFQAVMSANLTRKAQTYSDADFARVIRQGLTPMGESVEFMPSSAFVHMTDQEVAAIVSYIRSRPPAGAERPAWQLGWKARWALARDEFPPGLTFVDDAAGQAPVDLGPAYAQGRHLASVACSECHGPALKGQPGGPPDLLIAGAYDPADFTRLMKTGVAAGGREVGMMSAVARKRFAHFTDAEIAAIRGYLAARAEAATARPTAG